jgi:hypothetical protein
VVNFAFRTCFEVERGRSFDSLTLAQDDGEGGYLSKRSETKQVSYLLGVTQQHGRTQNDEETGRSRERLKFLGFCSPSGMTACCGLNWWIARELCQQPLRS